MGLIAIVFLIWYIKYVYILTVYFCRAMLMTCCFEVEGGVGGTISSITRTSLQLRPLADVPFNRAILSRSLSHINTVL